MKSKSCWTRQPMVRNCLKKARSLLRLLVITDPHKKKKKKREKKKKKKNKRSTLFHTCDAHPGKNAAHDYLSFTRTEIPTAA